jgi:hypothetical protein
MHERNIKQNGHQNKKFSSKCFVKNFCPKKKKFFFTLIVVCSFSSKHSLLVFVGSDLIEGGYATQKHPHNTPRPSYKLVAISQPFASNSRPFCA